METTDMMTATQSIKGEICGPVEVRVEGFRRIHTDVAFVDMEPDEDGIYTPLVGYVVLEQAHAAVDMLGHRLVHVKHIDLRTCDDPPDRAAPLGRELPAEPEINPRQVALVPS